MRSFGNIFIFNFFVLLFILFYALPASAQNENRKVVQFSGVITTSDTLAGIMGAHVYVPKGGRGTTTNYYGYFSFPVLEGDSVVVSVVGFRKGNVIIPKNDGDSFTAIVALKEDTTYLPELEVLLFPTEELFKEAVLAFKLPGQGDLDNMDNNFDPMTFAEMARVMPMDGSMNHKYFMNQRAEYLFDAYGPRTNQLLNPFAWQKFIKSLKKK